MKQVININFHGRVVPIEVTAFELLKNYTESLNRYFAQEEGKEEIINDIESRIGELFQERISKGATCITDDDVNAIINSMGRPEDFEISEENQNTAAQNAGQQQEESNKKESHTSSGPKRLYRDENNKVLGGVCGGLSNYFGIDVVVVRIIFLILFFTFGFGLIPYIILWIAIPNSADKVIGSPRKKLYRDSDDKIIAGVCSGIGNYFGMSAWVPRVLFILPFLSIALKSYHWGFPKFLSVSFSPGAMIVYIILWLVLPEATTTAEKLEMKGEKVDIDSIKNSVMEEMKGVKQRAQKFGKEAAAYAQEKGKAMGEDVNSLARKSSRSLGDIIVLLLKIFAYFIVGSIVFGIFMSLVGLAIAAIGLLPIKDFVIRDGWQNAFAWGTFLFFIVAPIVGMLTWLIRRIAKVKANRKLIRSTFSALWVVGWVSLILLIASVTREFKRSNEDVTEHEIFLSNPKVTKLIITSETIKDKYFRSRWLKFEPFNGIDDDTAYIKSVVIQIVKSPNDSFKVTFIKLANGNNRLIAQQLADKIEYGGVQQDSLLQLDKGIAINKTDKFRNQRIILRVYVPVGKQIEIDKSMGWYNNFHFSSPFDDEYENFDSNDEAYMWMSDIPYIMKGDGLYTLDGKSSKDRKSKQVRIDNNGIEINNEDEHIKIDKNGIKINPSNNKEDRDDKIDRKLDSLEERQEREKEVIEKKYEKEKEKILNNNNYEPNAFLLPVSLPMNTWL